ncbi:hypothetical protein BC628DRAFT_1396379 [Trametes gibbosa]|nr:hypothetical protein BC628DRAFT_1396379 [Trametes gibbosa]
MNIRPRSCGGGRAEAVDGGATSSWHHRAVRPSPEAHLVRGSCCRPHICGMSSCRSPVRLCAAPPQM